MSIARIKAGESAPLVEPSAAPTVADLAERYQREYVAMHCKPLTVSHYGLMLRKHIVPALGKLPVSEVERMHIMAVSVRAEGHAHGGEPGRGNPCQDVQPGRCVGMASVRQESLPVRAPLQGGEAPRAVPDRRGTL